MKTLNLHCFKFRMDFKGELDLMIDDKEVQNDKYHEYELVMQAPRFSRYFE